MKKEELIKGKWYKSDTSDYGIGYMKYTHHNEFCLFCTDSIEDAKFRSGETSWVNSIMTNSLELLTDLSEIQQYLPDGHEDKVKLASAIIGAEATKGVLLPKSERYIATMKFFEQLKEPERSEAIANYDENYTDTIPSSLSVALLLGFAWDKSKKVHSYWDNLYKSIRDNTYFKEPETLVKPKDYKEAVHCTTQEEFDFVLSKFNPQGLTTDKWSTHCDGTYIVTAGLDYVGCFGSKGYIINKNYTSLTFKQWCDKYNHCYVTASLEGRYIKCLKENDWNGGKTKVGDVLKIRKSDSVGDLFIGPYCLDNERLRDGEFELLPIDYTPDLIKEETMFKKGDYIVTLINDGNCGKVNYCSKQKCDETYLSPEIDTKGNTNNRNYTLKFSDKSGWKWRFATKEEGEEYERHGKPYNVGSLLSSKIPDKPSEVDISYRVDKIGNFYIDDICVSNCTSITPKEVYTNISIPVPTNIILKTKSKSIKL
jgi:hypothetical protein